MEEPEESLLEDNNVNDREKGGFRTLPFIIGNDSLEQMATVGLMPNMTLYLMKKYNVKMTTASNVLFIWSSTSNFMPLLGAIVADSFLGRFYTIGFGSIICLMGLVLLWSTTIIPQARPPPCDQSSANCSPTIFQFMYLCTSFGLISIGAGGVGSCSLPFGADQLEKRNFKSTVKERYFGWYYAFSTLSVLIALTCVVYVQENLGWAVGLAVPAVLMLFSVVLFFLAAPFYVKLKGKTSLVIGLVRVVVASFRNRHLELSDSTNYACHHKRGSPVVLPSEKLRFLNKSCIIKDPVRDLTPEGTPTNPWSLCTVDQVEELKSLIRIIPIWSTGMIMSINISQSSFPVLQADAMNRRITPSFTIPAASFGMFTIVSIIIWVALYDRVFLPLASRVKGRPFHINPRTRMGFGIFLSILAMMVSSIVEGIRRSLATNEGFWNLSQVNAHMSAMWLIPQHCLSGFAVASNVIAQNEFYFSELPRSMSSIASCLYGIGMMMANLVASFIMNVVDSISKAAGKESWISSNINEGHYDYYYLVLAGISMANMIYFLVCSRGFGTSKEDMNKEEHEDEY